MVHKSIPKLPPQAIAIIRLATLRRFAAIQKKHGAAKAADIVGASLPTLWRWRVRLKARGLAGLKPKPASGGRRSPFQRLRLPADSAREIERLAVEHGSRSAALRQFAGSPLCPPVLARYIARTGHMPARFDNFGRVTRSPAMFYASLDGRRCFIKWPLAARRSVAGAFVYTTAASVRLKSGGGQRR